MENLFNLHQGKRITVVLKEMEEGHYIYKGVLVGKEIDFVYLMEGEIYFSKRGSNEMKLVKNFSKIAINKNLIATVEFP